MRQQYTITRTVTMVFEDDFNNTNTRINIDETVTEILSKGLIEYRDHCRAIHNDAPVEPIPKQEVLISFEIWR